VQAVGDGSSEELLEREVGADAFAPGEAEGFLSLRRESFSLERFGPRVEICLSLTLASASGGPPPPCFVWEQPGIRPGALSGARPFEEDKAAEVQEYERQQLEALGYIN